MTDDRPGAAVAGTPERPLRILVVDDHEVVRQGLVALLDRRPNFQVVAEAGTVEDRPGPGASTRAGPRDHGRPPPGRLGRRGLPGHPGRASRHARRDADVVSGRRGRVLRDRRRRLGYLLKQVRARDLVAALEAVGRGESLLDPAVTEKVLARVRQIASGEVHDELAGLTPQERKILMLVAEGMTNKEIAGDDLPVRQDREELRELDPGEAQPGAPRTGRRLRRAAPPRSGPVARGSVSDSRRWAGMVRH